MGYFNIIDSLSDKRVDEGMVSSISKNTKKQNKDTKRMVDAVLSGQISKLSSKDMDISLLVRNDTKLSKNNKKNEKYCIVGTKGGVLRTEVRGYEINGDYVVAVIGYNLHKGTTVGKAMLWECSNEDVFNSNGDAKDFYKKIRGIGVEKWVNRVKIMGGTIVLECF